MRTITIMSDGLMELAQASVFNPIRGVLQHIDLCEKSELVLLSKFSVYEYIYNNARWPDGACIGKCL